MDITWPDVAIFVVIVIMGLLIMRGPAAIAAWESDKAAERAHVERMAACRKGA